MDEVSGASVAANLGQFLDWVAARPRNYGETMAAWRTSCPRLAAWEDAIEAGLVRVAAEGGQAYAEARVELTARGAARLADGARAYPPYVVTLPHAVQDIIQGG